MSRWPDFFIVGAPRAGTSSLHAYLKSHPEIFMPDNTKEPNFFGAPQRREKGNPYTDFHPVMSEKAYLSLFEKSNGFKMVGEATVSYLWDKSAPYNIKQQVPDAKIIMVLRDPVELAYSGYNQFGDHRLPFQQSLKEGREQLNLESGLYYEQVKRYLEVFSPDHVLILMFEDMRRDAGAVLDRIARFLGVSSDLMAKVDTSYVFNRYRRPRGALGYAVLKGPLRLVAGPVGQALLSLSLRNQIKDRWLLERKPPPPLDPESRAYLQEFYAPDLEKLEELLGTPLPQLRASWR